MTRARKPARVDAKVIASLVITVEGCKVIKDSDLAALLGISLPVFYKRIGRKLWILKQPAYFTLAKPYARGRRDSQPSLAFTQSGVIMVASILGDDASLEIGMDVINALRNRRRNSVLKKRPSRRNSDTEKALQYSDAVSRLLRGRLSEMLKKMRH